MSTGISNAAHASVGVLRHEDHGPPFAAQLLGARLERGDVDLQVGEESRVPDRELPSVDGADDALPRDGPEVRRRGELERRFAALKRALDPAGGLWIAWPKRSSGVETDLTEDVVREIALAKGLVDNKVCAIDETWSGLRLVYRLSDRPRTRT